MNISGELVEKTTEWLGVDGISFFKDIKKKHGEIGAVYSECGIPHSVHFNEGMQVKNFLQGTGLCDNWTCHELDDNWAEVIDKCLK